MTSDLSHSLWVDLEEQEEETVDAIASEEELQPVSAPGPDSPAGPAGPEAPEIKPPF